MIVARGATARLHGQFQIAIARDRLHRGNRFRRQGGPPEIGVDHHAGGVNHREKGLARAIGQLTLGRLQQTGDGRNAAWVGRKLRPRLCQDGPQGPGDGDGAEPGVQRPGGGIGADLSHRRQTAARVRMADGGSLSRDGLSPCQSIDCTEVGRMGASVTDLRDDGRPGST